MKSVLAKCLGLVAALLLLASVSQQMVQAQTTPSWSVITPTRVIIKSDKWKAPMEANVAFSNKANLLSALGRYGNFPPAANLQALINDIEAANMSATGQVPGMTGLGGVLGRALLDAAKEAKNTSGNFDTMQQVLLSVSGQITDYQFTEIGTTGAGNGSLEVITYITWAKWPRGMGAAQTQTDAYRWKISVINDGFSIVEKGSDPDNPFPGTLEFTPVMKARINDLGFMHKLWAKGTDIKIDEVAKKAGNSNNFVVLQESVPANAKLYAEIDENCIDMLFVDRPPATLEGMQPPLYCLGRCGSPLIVNTGV